MGTYNFHGTPLGVLDNQVHKKYGCRQHSHRQQEEDFMAVPRDALQPCLMPRLPV